MLFKGTSRKSSLEIVKLIEGLGGSFDAYTAKENLIILTKFLSEHINHVFELIAEILFESKIAEDELNKEKSVVLEEIKSNNEDPGEYVFDLLFKALFPNNAMGMPIAGSEDSIQKIDARMVHKYYHDLLRKKMVIAISGNFNYEKILNLTQTKFPSIELLKTERKKPSGEVGKIIVQSRKDISQVHFVVATIGAGYPSKLRHHLSILNTAFGGGMSSRLFQGLREKEGLVYDVQSFLDLYSDCGITGFYFVCDKTSLKKVSQQLKIILSEINKDGFNKAEIELAKTYLSGNLLLSLENSTNRMLRLGREMSYLNEVTTIDGIISKIKGIKYFEINELIKEYLDPTKYTVAAVGPIKDEEVEGIMKVIGA